MSGAPFWGAGYRGGYTNSSTGWGRGGVLGLKAGSSKRQVRGDFHID